MVELVKRAVKEKQSLPPVKEKSAEDDEMDSYFMDSEPDFDVISNVVSILPSEYDIISEVEDGVIPLAEW